MRKLLFCASILGAIGLASGAAADQPGGVKIGTLSCHESSGWGYVLGSARQLHCIYNGAEGRTRYVGSISRIGVDVGYQSSGDIVWAVFAPTSRMGPRALSGHYGGVTASATVGVGLGANALIGGSDRTIALQPVSVEGSTGLDVAGGIGGINLHAVPGSFEPA
jgi:Protein of unknown function (DUF992)